MKFSKQFEYWYKFHHLYMSVLFVLNPLLQKLQRMLLNQLKEIDLSSVQYGNCSTGNQALSLDVS